MNLSREHEEMKELKILALIGASSSNSRRSQSSGTAEEIKFFTKILEFFNFNASFAKRDIKCKAKLKLLVSVIPSFKELKKVLKKFPSENNV